VDTSNNVSYKMNNVTNEIVEEAITTSNPGIIGILSILDADIFENAEGVKDIDHKSATPYTIHTAVLPKPSLSKYQLGN
jgi:hypothetical protein